MTAHDAMVPFRVEFLLDTPMREPEFPLHLDALLSWAVMDLHSAAGDWSDTPWENQHALPLEKYVTPTGWCFKASQLRFDWADGPFQSMQSRRANIDEFQIAFESGIFRRLPSFDPLRGNTKAMLIQAPMRLVKSASAEGVGRIDEVRRLLDRVKSLCSLRRRGAGRVRQFSVETIQSNDCRWSDRNLPIDAEPSVQDGHAIGVGALQAPYFRRDRMGAALVPCN